MAGLLIRSLQLTLDAIEGKEIEELDDVNKEIEFLKRELKVKDFMKLKKDENTINTVFYQILIPFFESMNQELKIFDEFFLENKVTLELYAVLNPKKIGFNDADLLSKIEIALFEEDGLINHSKLKFAWKGFRHNRDNPQSIFLEFTVCFEKYDYVLNCDAPDIERLIQVMTKRGQLAKKRTEIKKMYHESISLHEQKLLINELKKEVLQKIKEFS